MSKTQIDPVTRNRPHGRVYVTTVLLAALLLAQVGFQAVALVKIIGLEGRVEALPAEINAAIRAANADFAADIAASVARLR